MTTSVVTWHAFSKKRLFGERTKSKAPTKNPQNKVSKYSSLICIRNGSQQSAGVVKGTEERRPQTTSDSQRSQTSEPAVFAESAHDPAMRVASSAQLQQAVIDGDRRRFVLAIVGEFLILQSQQSDVTTSLVQGRTQTISSLKEHMLSRVCQSHRVSDSSFTPSCQQEAHQLVGRQNAAPLEFDPKPSEAAFSTVFSL